MRSFLRYSKNRILYSLFRLLIFIVIGFIIGSLKVNAATVSSEFKIVGHTLDDEWSMSSNSNASYSSDYFLFSSTSVPNYIYMDLCTTGYVPTIWITGYGSNTRIQIDTKVYKVNKSCYTSGYKASVYRFTFNVISHDDAGNGNLGLTFNTRLFSNTDYITYFRLLSISFSDSLSYDDIDLSNQENIIEQNNKTNEELEKTNEKLDEAQETRKGIWQTIKELPNKFLEMLKSLFIPEDMSFLNNLKESLEDKLGFIASIPLQLIDYILNLPNKVFTPITSISFPEIDVFGVKFWAGQEVDITEGLKWFQAMKYFGDILCVILVVNTLNRWYKSFGGGN